MKALRLVGAMLLGIALTTAAALADASTTVTVPTGLVKQTLDTIEPLVATLLAGAAAWAVAKMPLYISAFVGTNLIEHLLSRAVDYAFNVVTDATKGEKVNIDTGNRMTKAGLGLRHCPLVGLAEAVYGRRAEDPGEDYCAAGYGQGDGAAIGKHNPGEKIDGVSVRPRD